MLTLNRKVLPMLMLMLNPKGFWIEVCLSQPQEVSIKRRGKTRRRSVRNFNFFHFLFSTNTISILIYFDRLGINFLTSLNFQVIYNLNTLDYQSMQINIRKKILFTNAWCTGGHFFDHDYWDHSVNIIHYPKISKKFPFL